jgi:hypothetical protein
MWRVRDDSFIADDVRDCLSRYYAENIDHFLSLKNFVNSKPEKKAEAPKTKFEFDSPLEAQMFLEVVGKLTT